MDELDCEIMMLLGDDARTPFKNIANKLGRDVETVRRRFRKLKRKGIILGSTVILSSSALGYSNLVGFYIKTKSGYNPSVIANKILENPIFDIVFEFSGLHNLYAESLVKNLEKIREMIEHLRKIDGIDTVDAIVYEQRDWPLPYPISFSASRLFPKAKGNLRGVLQGDIVTY